MTGAELKNIHSPDEVREFPLIRAEMVNIGGGTVALMTAQPGWRWTEHVKPVVGGELCQAPHFMYVVSGRTGARLADGTEYEVGPGDVVVLPAGHDGWVIGDEPAVMLDWGGAHVWGKPVE